MTREEKIAKLKVLFAWVNDADMTKVNSVECYLGNEDGLEDTRDPYFSITEQASEAEDLIEVDEIEALEWVEGDYGNHYFHIVMKDGQGYEITTFDIRQRSIPVERLLEQIEEGANDDE